MPKLTLLVGPPGSGKSTLARKMATETGATYVNQDSQKGDHMDIFFDAVLENKDIIVDRMNFNKQQRAKYLEYAKLKNPDYFTEIIVLHESYETCLNRVRSRFGNHETINEEKSARGALATFFGKYERPELGEAKLIVFKYPDGPKEKVIVCDLDGTLCDVEHRRHHVRPPVDNAMNGGTFDPSTMTLTVKPFKKNWPAFFAGIPNDTVNEWCKDIILAFADKGIETVFCSGRGSNERKATQEWLDLNGFGHQELYMRDRHDSRQDSIVKEMILDFELLTRYEPYFMIDDREQVVQMWRKRGFVCLQCDEGKF